MVLYYWLIPNRNVNDGIRIVISWVRGASAKGTKGRECGSDGRVILDRYFDGCIGCSFAGSGSSGGGCWFGCTGADCSGILVCVSLIPSIVQEGTVIIILCVHSRSRVGGWYW